MRLAFLSVRAQPRRLLSFFVSYFRALVFCASCAQIQICSKQGLVLSLDDFNRRVLVRFLQCDFAVARLVEFGVKVEAGSFVQQPALVVLTIQHEVPRGHEVEQEQDHQFVLPESLEQTCEVSHRFVVWC